MVMFWSWWGMCSEREKEEEGGKKEGRKGKEEDN